MDSINGPLEPTRSARPILRLALLLMMMSTIPMAAASTDAVAFGSAVSQHPHLLVRAAQYEQLRERASRQPWRDMQAAVKACTSLTYASGGSAYRQYSSMTHLMRQAALACILFPQDRQRYVDHLVAQFNHWDDLNATRRQRPRSDWASMITGGDAFFTSVLALDIIHDDLDAATLARIEARLQTWYEFERDEAQGSWYLAKYGALGLWDLYVGDAEAFETHARAYDDRLRQHFTDDGVALVGGSYASARLAGGELAKTYFMDILTFQGWHDYYNDPLLGAFYEWFYAGMLTPTQAYAIFQDCREAPHSGTGGFIANYRAHRFSRTAAAHAAWLQPRKPVPGILGYVLIDEPLPEARPPTSRLWSSGYAALWEDANERALMAALWTPNRAFQHDHYEINAIHLTGYGQTLLRNPGYEGWGNPAAGFSWNYVRRFDIRPAWDYAVGGNIAYLDRNRPHVSKAGGGLQEGILHPALDYAAGDAGDAVKGGEHQRSLLLVKDRQSGALPYFLLFDEMTRITTQDTNAGVPATGTTGTSVTTTTTAMATSPGADSGPSPLRIAWHPASNHGQVITPQQSYRWAFEDSVFLTIFLATPAAPGTRLKQGGLSQFDEPPMYLHAEYDFPDEQTQALTLLIPHEGIDTVPSIQRLAGDDFSGVNIRHNNQVHDIAFAGQADAVVKWDGLEIEGRAALLRFDNDVVDFYFVRQGRGLEAPTAIGFDAAAPVSIVLQGRSARIVSPGTYITFTLDTPSAPVLLDGEPITTILDDRHVTFYIAAGTHQVEFGH